MNSSKRVENKKEDSKAFGKFIGVTLISAFVGGVIGFCAAFFGGSEKAFVETFTDWLGKIALILPFVLSTALGIWDVLEEKKCRKLFLNWDGEEEALVEQIEKKLSYVLISSNVTMISVYFFFGAAMYAFSPEHAGTRAGAMHEFVRAFVALAGLIYSIVIIVKIEKRVVNFEKEINPEKRGSVYDPKFKQKWMESCDEGEQFQIYKCAYKSYQVTQGVCMALWVITIIGLMSFDFGLLPMTCVVIIWLTQSLSYGLATLQVSK